MTNQLFCWRHSFPIWAIPVINNEVKRTQIGKYLRHLHFEWNICTQIIWLAFCCRWINRRWFCSIDHSWTFKLHFYGLGPVGCSQISQSNWSQDTYLPRILILIITDNKYLLPILDGSRLQLNRNKHISLNLLFFAIKLRIIIKTSKFTYE